MSHARTFLTAISALALSAVASAQTPAARPTPRGARGADTRPSAEAEALAAQRRAQAVAMLTTLADQARDFRDETVRARAQARAADALWETDPKLARTLFRRAWEAADSADREAARKLEEEVKAQLARHGTAMTSTPPDLRAEVLRLAAHRDRALGEEFLKQLVKASEQEAGDAAADATSTNTTSANATSPSSISQAEQSPDAGQRLGLAQDLLNEGDTQHAIQFADAALNSANIQSVGFLSALREKDAAEADRRFAGLLARAAADPASDANTVSLLSSYVFQPFVFFMAYRSGGTGMSALRAEAPAPDAPALRAAFLRAAAQILLRPATPQDYERTSAGRSGTYLIIRRLLPYFELQAPELAAALNARAAALLPDVPERVRAVAEREARRAAGSEDAPRDEV
ncbi:MAG: hypothetical protein M3379_18755, partial [Acidobacteriota bacterium]|nr:hypothetical protein [Acidobacteriota bacterium]